MIRQLLFAFAIVIIGGVLSAYTATITDAQISGTGVCLRIKICWGSDEEAPTGGNTGGTEAFEIDPLTHDPLGEDSDGGSAIEGTYTENPETGQICQEFWFCFPKNDCEFGDEEYSALVVITGSNGDTHDFPANGADGNPFAKNIC